MIFGGADPGQKGCLTFWDDKQPEVHHFIDMPLLKEGYRHGVISIDQAMLHFQLLNLILSRGWRPEEIMMAVEHLYMSRKNANGLETSWTDFGILLGVLSMVCIPYKLFRPATWQSITGKPDGKDWSITFAQRWFPHAELIKPGARKPSDGRADALCIMKAGQLQWQFDNKTRRR